MSALATRVERLEAKSGTSPPEVTDRSAWDWYADSCPCSRPAGECSTHPRARSTQRPPAGDWRVLRLKDAFQNYRRQRRGGQWIDFPADSHPEEDMIDALRGGVRDALPEGNALVPYLPRAHAPRIL